MKFIETIFEEADLHQKPSSFGKIYLVEKRSKVKYWTYGLLLSLLIAGFIPWTQNIRSKGKVTTLRQEQRPQGINSAISGKIIKWYVKEGDMVKAGDTIARLAEVKVEYLDPQLLDRTRQQISAKEQSIANYQNKANTASQQANATAEALKYKIAQLQNKVEQTRAKIRADSMDMLAAKNEFSIATEQFKRQKQLYEQGLVSLTQFEQRNQAYQNSLAKRTSSEIKWMNSKQDLANLSLELSGTRQEYTEKLSKIEGERYQSLSQIASGEADIAKLENQYSSYQLRNGMYYVIAPQTGQITKANKAGTGEIIKEGEELVEIVPTQADLAIEMFVKPLDIPLLQLGQKVQIIFDGFPAIVFSGWPRQSYGTFSGNVVAISNTVNTEGKFRILVAPNPSDRPWAENLRIGTAADTFTLLKDVPLGYEIWRNINGFPPEYYKMETKEKKK